MRVVPDPGDQLDDGDSQQEVDRDDCNHDAIAEEHCAVSGAEIVLANFIGFYRSNCIIFTLFLFYSFVFSIWWIALSCSSFAEALYVALREIRMLASLF